MILKAVTAVGLGLAMMLAHMPDASAQHRGKGKGGGGGPVYSKPSGGGHHGGRHRGSRNNTGKIVGGIAAGIAGAIILNEVARSSQDRGYSYGGGSYARGGDGRLNCRGLAARCEDGAGWACRRFDRECDR
jgi:hypothetical protein